MRQISQTIRNGLRSTKHFYLPGFCVLGGSIYMAQQSGWALPWWINNYVNDFLCMPIVLFVCQYAVRKLKADSSVRLSLPLVLSVTLYYAVFFEYYLPKVNLRYTSDLWDVILYFSSALFFYAMENKAPKAV